MGTPQRQPGDPGVADFLAFAASAALAIAAWLGAISTPESHGARSVPFALILTGTTLLALGNINRHFNPFYQYGRWSRRRADNKLYGKLYDHAARAYSALAAASDDARRAELEDEVRHLRTALCVLRGWDPTTEADTGGLADKAIERYRENHDPEQAPDAW